MTICAAKSIFVPQSHSCTDAAIRCSFLVQIFKRHILFKKDAVSVLISVLGEPKRWAWCDGGRDQRRWELFVYSGEKKKKVKKNTWRMLQLVWKTWKSSDETSYIWGFLLCLIQFNTLLIWPANLFKEKRT